ncbi:MAG: DNA polymerase IV [Desulfobacterales bacterium]|nr:DNA polymerase IV [Desulfobacterales bacterium]
MAVGGGQRGVVAAASYEARKFGVRSAIPIFQAKQKCPHLIIVPPRRRRYAELSQHIMEILGRFSPLVEPISIDEAFVDLAGCQRLHGPAQATGLAIKKQIREQTGLNCSVGIAPNKFLAKIASDLNKPDGLTIISAEQMMTFIETLPIQKVPGVGARTQQRLAGMGISTLGQVRGFSEAQLVRRLGVFGHRLMELALGHDDSPVVVDSEAKSMSSEITLDQDTRDRALLATHLLAQAEAVARDLRRHQVRSRTITLKLRTADFQRHTRGQTLKQPVDSADAIYQTALDLLDAFDLKLAIRLIGVGAGHLQSRQVPLQQELFSNAETQQRRQWEKVDRAMDAIDERYGRHCVMRGTLAEPKKSPSKCFRHGPGKK